MPTGRLAKKKMILSLIRCATILDRKIGLAIMHLLHNYYINIQSSILNFSRVKERIRKTSSRIMKAYK